MGASTKELPRTTKQRRAAASIATAGVIAFLSGCGFEGPELSEYQGSLQLGRTDTILTDSSKMHGQYISALVNADTQGYSASQVAQEALRRGYRVEARISGVEGPVRASIGNIKADGSNPHMPFSLSVKAEGDGPYSVTVSARECVNSPGYFCTQWATGSLSGRADINPPRINFYPPGPAQDGSGVLIGGEITDGKGVGVESATVSQCDGSSATQIALDGQGKFGVSFPPVPGETCYMVSASDRVGHNGQKTQVFTYNLGTTVELENTSEGQLQAVGHVSSNLYPPVKVTLQECTDNGCTDIPVSGYDPQIGSWKAEPFSPEVGDNTVRPEVEDKFGNTAIGGEKSFQYDLQTTSSLTTTPDGKLEVVGSATSNLSVPRGVTVVNCVEDKCVDIPVIAFDPQTGAWQTQATPPRVGNNILQPTVLDRHGKAAQGEPLTYQYDFSLQAGAAVQEDGTITVVVSPTNSLFPNLDIQVKSMADPAKKVQAVRDEDGSYIATGLTPDIGETHLVATAQDVHGNTVTSEAHALYDFGPGDMRIQMHDGYFYLYGNPPTNIIPETFSAQGKQPDWRRFGLKREVACEHMGANVTINGHVWKYTLKCSLPTKSGDAMVHIDFKDRFGHTYSAYHAVDAQLAIDLRDKPTAKEVSLILVRDALILATIGATGIAATKRVNREVRRARGIKVGRLLLDDQWEAANSYLNGGVRQRLFKVSAEEIDRVHALQRISQKEPYKGKNLAKLLRLDIGESPIMSELRDTMLRGFVDGAISQCRMVWESRSAGSLLSHDVTETLRAVSQLMEGTLWSVIPPVQQQEIGLLVSALSLARRSISMPDEPFFKHYLNVTKGEKGSKPMENMVRLLCHWGNMTAAQKFIERSGRGDVRKGLEAIYQERVAEIKASFGKRLEMQEGSISEDIKPWLTTLSLKLPDSLQEELQTAATIACKAQMHEYCEALLDAQKLLAAHPENIVIINGFLYEALFGIRDVYQSLIDTKDRKFYRDKALISTAQSIVAMSEQPYWREIHNPRQAEVVSQAQELLLVTAPLGKTPEEFVAGLRPPIHEMSHDQLVHRVFTFATWRDLKSADLLVEHYPDEEIQRKLRTALRKKYIEPLLISYAGAVRTKGPAYGVSVLAQYSRPEEVDQQALLLGSLEGNNWEGKPALALDNGRELLKRDESNWVLIKDTMSAAIEGLHQKWKRILRDKNRELLQDGTVSAEVALIVSLEKEPWWQALSSEQTSELVREAEELTLVASAQHLSADVFLTAYPPAEQKGTKANRIVETLCAWGDMRTASTFIENHPVPKRRADLSALLEQRYLGTLRSTYVSAVRNNGIDDGQMVLYGYSLPDTFLEGCRVLGGMEEAARAGHYQTSLESCQAAVAKHVGLIPIIQDSLIHTLDLLAQSWTPVVTAKQRRSLNEELLTQAAAVDGLSKESWWSRSLSTKSADIIAQAQELLLVASAQTMPDATFLAVYPPSKQSPAKARAIIDTLFQWGDLKTSDLFAQAHPEDDHKRQMVAHLQKHISTLQGNYVAAVRSGGKVMGQVVLRDYSLPDEFKRECMVLESVEETTRAGDYKRSLEVCQDEVDRHPNLAPVIRDSLIHTLNCMAQVWKPIVTAKQRSGLADGRVLSQALVLNSMAGKPWWKDLRHSQKDVLLQEAEELILVGAAQGMSPTDFISTTARSHVSTRLKANAFVRRFCAWGDYATAAACVDHYPSSRDKEELRRTFDDMLQPRRKAYIAALRNGRPDTSVELVFPELRLPTSFEAECLKLQEIVRAEKSGDAAFVIREANKIIQSNGSRLEVLNPVLGASLTRMHGELATVISSRDVTRLADRRLSLFFDTLAIVSKNPWWVNNFDFAHKDALLSQMGELQFVAYAASSTFHDFSKRYHNELDDDIKLWYEIVRPLASWGIYEVAYACLTTPPQKDWKDARRRQFVSEYIIPKKKEYAAALESGPDNAARVLAPYRLGPKLTKVFQEVEADYSRYVHWVNYDLPDEKKWRYDAYMVGDTRDEIVQEVASICKKLCFEEGLPFAAAEQVTRRWYDTVYFVYDAYVFQFFGLTEADINAAQKTQDYGPMLRRVYKGMNKLMIEFNRSVPQNGDVSLQDQINKAYAKLVHQRFSEEYHLPLKRLIATLPSRPGAESKLDRVGDVRRLAMTEIPDDIGLPTCTMTVERAKEILMSNALYMLLNDTTANIRGFNDLKIKPIVRITDAKGDHDTDLNIDLCIV
ncbi:MAG: hypothetical protein WC489_04325 [Patescibacteria group bacterium]